MTCCLNEILRFFSNTLGGLSSFTLTCSCFNNQLQALLASHCKICITKYHLKTSTLKLLTNVDVVVVINNVIRLIDLLNCIYNTINF